MDAVTEPLQELVAHARDTRVVVIGGGIAGLVAAWECAKVGMAVTVVEASTRLGGVIGTAEASGLRLDVGATCWSTRGGAVRRLVDEVLPDAVIVRPRDDSAWIAGLPKGAAAPLPPETFLGIPANPWDEGVRRIIGWGGTWRAYLDRLRPPLTIGSERSLGRLVAGRMGPTVRDRLVAPLSVDRFGLDPDDVDVEVVAPALNPALTRTGSLGGAVAELVADAPGPSVEGLDGGMPQLIAALHARLADRAAVVHTGARATGLVRDGKRWTVVLASAPEGVGTEVPVVERAERDETPVPTADSEPFPAELTADAVIVATDEDTARALLRSAVDDPAFASTEPAGIAREVVTLVVDAPALDGAPRGAHVHAVPGSGTATGLVHETARWEWLARDAGPGRHVLRVAFGAPGAQPATAGLDDTAAFTMAAREASTLLGVPVERIVAAHRDRFTLVPPASATGQRERATTARAAVAKAHGLAAVGAWLAGSGLAQVVADAQTEADRMRRGALWGEDPHA
ncbi:FAD-dependent oxidoreductase [Microbacterium sp. NEAU-LLC]|uniref:FAD-dependent oxidoreductase n=1 Tax=Microbacterium helvum TaxID=2773713 RepID=A0ABR8NNF2_9MICO|nr:FAD-dependent oxidoreductase [Microbacterium helvum]MBD3942192.1 FAD-dependent oxidoreductase [Microbacterium helvum]